MYPKRAANPNAQQPHTLKRPATIRKDIPNPELNFAPFARVPKRFYVVLVLSKALEYLVPIACGHANALKRTLTGVSREGNVADICALEVRFPNECASEVHSPKVCALEVRFI